MEPPARRLSRASDPHQARVEINRLAAIAGLSVEVSVPEPHPDDAIAHQDLFGRRMRRCYR